MKSYGSLSWLEKCRIRDGSANPYSYQTGYSFQTKVKVAEGKQPKKPVRHKR